MLHLDIVFTKKIYIECFELKSFTQYHRENSQTKSFVFKNPQVSDMTVVDRLYGILCYRQKLNRIKSSLSPSRVNQII